MLGLQQIINECRMVCLVPMVMTMFYSAFSLTYFVPVNWGSLFILCSLGR